MDFLKLTFSKKSFWNTIRVSNSLDPDQARQHVGPDLGTNCLQRLSADDKSPLAGKELKERSRTIFLLRLPPIFDWM